MPELKNPNHFTYNDTELMKLSEDVNPSSFKTMLKPLFQGRGNAL